MNAFVTSLGGMPSGRLHSGVSSGSTSSFAGCPVASRTARIMLPKRCAVMQMENDEEPLDDIGGGMGRQRPEQGVEEAKLFVGNLSWNTTDASLGDAFSEFGEVIDSKVVTDRFTGKSRGFGFITFAEADAADSALENMNGAEVDGRPIRLDRANKRVGGPPRPRREFY